MYRSSRELILSSILGFCVFLALYAPATAAQPPYEPNDSLLTAFGPLGLNQTYKAAIETQNDRDFYYFYVTAAAGSQVQLTIKNLGGSGYLNLYLDDSHGEEIRSVGVYNGTGDYEVLNISLEPGKYFAEVNGHEGTSYSLTTSGTDGAFGEFAAISSQCQAATGYAGSVGGELETAKATLQVKEGHLRKARARLYRALRHRSRRARKKAHRIYAAASRAIIKAKEAVKAKEGAYKAAVNGEQPWCSIPQ
jgi:Bacterial pre-peptidase C-terminal domain